MKKLLLLAIITHLSLLSLAQLTQPKAEGVYGGKILDITGYKINGDSSMIYVSTESPNSIFYARIKTGGTGLTQDSFRVVKSVSSASGFGSGITSLAVHSSSGLLAFGHPSGLYITHIDSVKATRADSFNTELVYIKDSVLLYMQGNNLHYKKFRAGSIFSPSVPAFSIPGTGNSKVIFVHPVTYKVYVLIGGNTPLLYKSSEPYYNLSSTSTFSSVSLSTLSSAISWEGMGIGPDGRIFIGGADGTGKKIAWSDNEVIWTIVNTGIAGRPSNKFSFAGSASAYRTYYSTGYATAKGTSWYYFGNAFQQTHPNDGYSFADPNDTNDVYLNTDAGLGASANGGSIIFDINNGIEALQVNGFDMTADKKTAWVASKAGLRRVMNYNLPGMKWSDAIFPMFDGSPFYAVAMVNNDSNRVYSGNNRVYKSTNGGRDWARVFTPEDPPYNFNNVGIFINRIAVCPFDSNLIAVTYSGASPLKGGLFISTNASISWNQVLLNATGPGQDINLTDAVFLKEGSDTILYVSAQMNTAIPISKNVIRLKKNGSSWLISQDMNASNMADGVAALATINDLERNLSGDTLYAAAVDSISALKFSVYMKPVNSGNKWIRLKTTGLPAAFSGSTNKIALGSDTLYTAINNTLYYYPVKDSVWFWGYTYAAGTQVNFLYYDDLLAGTGTGLYGHKTSGSNCRPAYSLSFNAQVCQGDSFLFNGGYIKMPGLYIDTIQSAKGCDSIIASLQVAVSPKYLFSSLATICPGETFIFPDGLKSDTALTHPSLLKSKNGCDSTVTITLTINRPDVSITVRKDTLTANEPIAAYQWLYCDSNFAAIPGANQRSFTASKTGNYAVRVTKNNCIDTSDCFHLESSGLASLDAFGLILIYPNPAIGSIQVDLETSHKLQIRIIRIEGDIIFENQVTARSIQIPLTEIKAGIYLLQLTDLETGGTVTRKFQKSE